MGRHPLSNLSYAKVLAFADDTVLGLASISDLRRAEFWIELFQAVSGARVNWDKSCLWGLGPWATEPPAWPTHPELKWVVGSVKYLGICLRPRAAATAQWEDTIGKVKRKLGLWDHASLSIWGRVRAMNVLVLPLICYLAMF